MLIDQIKENSEDSQEEANKNFVKGVDRFSGKAL